MTNYLSDISTKRTPQSEPIPGKSQVANSAGGFSFGVDKWTRFNRFLILGSEGGSYYANQRDLTMQNVACIQECISEDGLRAVSLIVQVSDEGRAPKNDPAIFALAVASAASDDKTRAAALQALPKVCRIGTHLFNYMTFVKNFRGLGRGLRNALGAWYLEKEADDLAYQLIKYRQRDGWTHADVLRLAKPKGDDAPAINPLLRWAVGKGVDVDNPFVNEALPEKVIAFEVLQGLQYGTKGSSAQAAKLIREYNLPREAVPTEFLADNVVLEALLEKMPIGALIRNLASMTSRGLLTSMSSATGHVVKSLTNADAITRGRIHPISVLAALKTYESGRSLRGEGTWTPIPRIVDALDDAFYLSFGNVPATGKSRCIALDVSGSMDGGMVAGVPGLTPRIASAAMSMVSMKTGDPYMVVAFTGGRGGFWGRGGQSTDSLSVLTLSSRQRLDDVVRTISGLPFGGTDCALPMLWATDNKLAFDVFEIYTDSETWAGSIHPSQALVEYRQKSGINAKLAVVGMVSNNFSIADPNDAGMLDVVGFDTATPALISAFAEGGF